MRARPYSGREGGFAVPNGPRGKKLFRFLAGLMLRDFYGAVTIRFEGGKATHVELQTRRSWEYRELPESDGWHGEMLAQQEDRRS